eukprot:TRINITY_DN5818_c0_g1_i5.p2 TRINITY_DN5818_c0_g1~~TRINITY_DN5818_c0_g1_i5.p2  ORF type:complete len:114 (-),score=9.35 TRINITY_DN5818_c0_g1_i5:973-1314(-)
MGAFGLLRVSIPILKPKRHKAPTIHVHILLLVQISLLSSPETATGIKVPRSSAAGKRKAEQGNYGSAQEYKGTVQLRRFLSATRVPPCPPSCCSWGQSLDSCSSGPLSQALFY